MPPPLLFGFLSLYLCINLISWRRTLPGIVFPRLLPAHAFLFRDKATTRRGAWGAEGRGRDGGVSEPRKASISGGGKGEGSPGEP